MITKANLGFNDQHRSNYFTDLWHREGSQQQLVLRSSFDNTRIVGDYDAKERLWTFELSHALKRPLGTIVERHLSSHDDVIVPRHPRFIVSFEIHLEYTVESIYAVHWSNPSKYLFDLSHSVIMYSFSSLDEINSLTRRFVDERIHQRMSHFAVNCVFLKVPAQILNSSSSILIRSSPSPIERWFSIALLVVRNFHTDQHDSGPRWRTEWTSDDRRTVSFSDVPLVEKPRPWRIRPRHRSTGGTNGTTHFSLFDLSVWAMENTHHWFQFHRCPFNSSSRTNHFRISEKISFGEKSLSQMFCV